MAQEKSNTHEQDDGQVALDFQDYEETTVTLPSADEEKKEQTDVVVEEDVVAEEASDKNAGSDDELADVSQNVKKRIDRLTKKMREAERREQEAINYAKNVQTEAQQLKSKLETVDQGYMSEYGNRLNIEQKQAEAAIKEALDRGDSEAVVQGQRKLTELAVSADRYNNIQRSREKPQQEEVSNVQQEVQQPQAQQAPVAPDPKAEKWASENEWFGKDEAMTFAAFGIHKRMVEEEGFDPKGDEYYDELDSRIRGKFPQEFDNGSGKRPVQNVAGNSRSRSKVGRKTQVKLTQSQVAIAKKLGVPLEEYAKYVKT